MAALVAELSFILATATRILLVENNIFFGAFPFRSTAFLFPASGKNAHSFVIHR
jgi:hypothetical protein